MIRRVLIEPLLVLGHVLFPVKVYNIISHVLKEFYFAFRPLVEVDGLDLGDVDSNLTVYNCRKWMVRILNIKTYQNIECTRKFQK